MNYILYTS